MHCQYSINKSKILLGFVGPQWEQHIVAELDSALNKWIDTVPDHCKWCNQSSWVTSLIICSALGPTPREPPVLQPIRHIIRNILPPSDSHPSSIHSLTPKTVTSDFPFAGNLHQRCPFVQPRRRHLPQAGHDPASSDSDCGLHRWHCPASQHLGSEEVRNVCRQRKADGGCTQVHAAPSQH